MAVRRGADLKISIEAKNSHTLSIITPLEGDPIECYGELSQIGLEKHREALRDDLDSLKGKLQEQLDQGNDWTRIEQAFAILRKRSNLLFHQLFGREKEAELHARLAAALAPARAAKRFALIEVITPNLATVPIEFLRIRQAPGIRIQDESSLLMAASEFIGFSSIVKRTVPRLDQFSAVAPVLDNDPRLRVKLFWDSSLSGAKWESEFFQRNGQSIDLEGPWPNGDLAGQSAYVTVAEHLWNPNLNFAGVIREKPDHIQHFACHFYIDDNGEKSFFRLGFNGATASATLGDIDSHLGEIACTQTAERLSRPLVFANACASSVIRPDGLLSLPELVLRNKHLGYIGTETRIPDVVARQFSEDFYSRLSAMEPLGEAVTQARLDLLRTYHNPLGILYTLYADPDIRVSNRRELQRGEG